MSAATKLRHETSKTWGEKFEKWSGYGVGKTLDTKSGIYFRAMPKCDGGRDPKLEIGIEIVEEKGDVLNRSKARFHQYVAGLCVSDLDQLIAIRDQVNIVIAARKDVEAVRDLFMVMEKGGVVKYGCTGAAVLRDEDVTLSHGGFIREGEEQARPGYIIHGDGWRSQVFGSIAEICSAARTNQIDRNTPKPSYEDRVRALEDEGCTRSDAQSVVDAQDFTADHIVVQHVGDKA